MPDADVMVIVPSFTPVHAASVFVVVAVMLPVRFTVILTVLVHPPEKSVTTIVCGPGATPLKVCGLGPVAGAPPSNTKV